MFLDSMNKKFENRVDLYEDEMTPTGRARFPAIHGYNGQSYYIMSVVLRA